MSLTDEDSDGDDFHEINARNFKRVCNGVSKFGYADGVEDGEKGAFQEGFDLGYIVGLKTGFENAKYKSFFNTIHLVKADVSQQLIEETDKYNAMALENSINVHQILEETTDSLFDINKKQNDDIDKRMENFRQTLPATTTCLTNR